MSIDPVVYIETTFGLELKRVGGDEYAGPCPWCGGRDRFHIWRDKGNYWCRPGLGHCGKSGFVDELTGDKLTNQELRLLAVEAKQRELERKQREHERRLSALEKMARCRDHITYHETMPEAAREYWWRQGMTDETIDRYLLGYCSSCPLCPSSPSYTIPIINHGQLENIRHRLKDPDTGGKYRPHIAGLGSSLFNADLLDGARCSIIVTEGEKKSIISTQSGFPAVGVCGKRSFRNEWLELFDRVSVVYIALDPDATESAEKVAAAFGGRGRVVDLPCKLDDMIVMYGAGADDIEGYLRYARPINAKGN